MATSQDQALAKVKQLINVVAMQINQPKAAIVAEAAIPANPVVVVAVSNLLLADF